MIKSSSSLVKELYGLHFWVQIACDWWMNGMLGEKKGKDFYFHMKIYADSDTVSMLQHKVESIFFLNSFF